MSSQLWLTFWLGLVLELALVGWLVYKRSYWPVIGIKWNATALIAVIVVAFMVAPEAEANGHSFSGGKNLAVVLCAVIIGAIWVKIKGRVVRWIATTVTTLWIMETAYNIMTKQRDLIWFAIFWAFLLVFLAIWVKPKPLRIRAK